MRNVLNRLWADDAGAIISVEWILFVGILLFGIIAGLVAARNTIVASFGTIGNTLLAILPNFTYSGWTYGGTPGGIIVAIGGVEFSITSASFLTADQTSPVILTSAFIPPSP